MGLKDGKLIPRSGLIATSRIEDLLRSYVARARLVPDFNKLPIPFRAVATDMLTGNMVVLDHGDIATAMRASMAVPGAFAPVGHGPVRAVGRLRGAQPADRRGAQHLRGRGHRRESCQETP